MLRGRGDDEVDATFDADLEPFLHLAAGGERGVLARTQTIAATSSEQRRERQHRELHKSEDARRPTKRPTAEPTSAHPRRVIIASSVASVDAGGGNLHRLEDRCEHVGRC